MENFINATRGRLESGQLALGMRIRQARTVAIANIAKTCGYDWLY